MTDFDLRKTATTVAVVQKLVREYSTPSFKLTNISIDVEVNKKKIGRIVSAHDVVVFEPVADFETYTAPDEIVKE